jgi:predicted enzyme related to lactoylglutathione lyase/quinol monooxygenase YgiN
MGNETPAILSLTSTWFVRPGREAAARRALERLAEQVQAGEPDTLAYLVHTPAPNEPPLQSLPPADSASIVFFETYRDLPAFLRHLNGPIFTGFVSEHGELFIPANGKPFVFVQFLRRLAGFVRGQAGGAGAGPEGAATNRHPAVMFEVIANDQSRLERFYKEVFGWTYQIGTGGFAYVKFPAMSLSLLGGIGQANPGEPGFSPGHSFYLQVDDVAAALQRALSAGGTALMPPTSIDGYRFAMVRDPEGNSLGLIEPFSAT